METQPLVNTDPPDRVPDDLHCGKCDYNLRKLSWDGLCPECGLAVAHSRLPDGFDFASRRDIARLRRGLWLIVVSVLTSTLLIIGYTVLFRYMTQLHQQGHSSFISACVRIWVYGSLMCRWLLMLGIVMVVAACTRRDLSRRLALVAYAMAAVCVGIDIISFAAPNRVPLWTGALKNYPLVAFVIGGAVVFAYLLLFALFWFRFAGRAMHGHLRFLRTAMMLAVTGPLIFSFGLGLLQGISFVIEVLGWNMLLGLIGDNVYQILDFAWWWSKDMSAIGAIIMLAAIVAFLRQLDARSPRLSTHAVVDPAVS